MHRNHFSEFNAFVAVAEHRNFTRAASRLDISPGTLSETIRGLEERLRVRLFNRTTRSVAVTEAGERLLARLRPLLADFDAAIDSLNDFRDTPSGTLRLTMPSVVATWVVAPMLPQFLAQYPEIKMEIVITNRMIDIVAERFDAGIRLGNRIERDMIAVRVSDDLQYAVVAAPDYLLRHPRPEKPQDLQSHNCIRFRFPNGAFLPWKFNIAGNAAEVAVDGSLIVNEPNLAIGAVRNCIGLFYGPFNYLKPLIEEGQLVRVLEQWMPAPSDGFSLFYPSRRQNPAALQALIEFLRRNLSAKERAALHNGGAHVMLPGEIASPGLSMAGK